MVGIVVHGPLKDPSLETTVLGNGTPATSNVHAYWKVVTGIYKQPVEGITQNMG